MTKFSYSEQIFDLYSNYYEHILNTRRFKHSDILPLVTKLKSNKNFEVKLIGKSVEEREIFSIKWGEGKTKVLLWSQMHGDEPTATMAIFDIINFLNSDDKFNEVRKAVKKNLSIYFIPMLNPDGTERVIRENALGIDLNRDALKLASPESKILKAVVDDLKPEYGFNLHDQDIRWSAGGNSNPATIALLSPQFDDGCTLNEVRENAINVIADIYNTLNKYIPGCIAKYGEDYEPRSFGDSITGWGTSVILIESGKRRDDPEKEFIRKLNFSALLESFLSISEKRKNDNALDVYKSIPSNGKLLYDLIFRNLSYKKNESTFNIDIAVNIEEYFDEQSKEQYFEGRIESIGDLKTCSGYKEIDCAGMEVKPGKIYKGNDSDLDKINSYKLLNEGFTHVLLNSFEHAKFVKYPLNIISRNLKQKVQIQVKQPANFFISDPEVRFTVVNGFVHDCRSEKNQLKMR